MDKERISFGSHYKFPLKLYEVADDETIIKWADDGSTVVVEQLEFEENVMHYYPGFVQVRSFHNLRRLFRDYGFRFQVLRKRKPYGLKVKFRHPFFTRAKPDDVVHVRKISRKYPLRPDGINSYLPRPYLQCTSVSKHRALRSYKYHHQLKSENHMVGNSCSGKYNLSSAAPSTTNDDYTISPSLEVLPEITGPSKMSHHQSQVSETASAKLTPGDIFRLAQILAKNEMPEGDIWQLVTRRCGQEWTDKSWDATLNLLTNIVNPELSPLNHPGFYLQLSLEDL